MRACETAVVLQGCVSRTADARQSQSAGPADTLQPGFVAFARARERERERASSFRESVGEAAFEDATGKKQRETKRSCTLFCL